MKHVIKLGLVVGTLLIFLVSCKENNQATATSKSEQMKAQQKLQQSTSIADSCSQYLTNGCILLRTGNDVISSMFAKFNLQDKTYSHCGIAFKENNQWYVYHSIGGEDNPDEKLRRDTYQRFVSNAHNLGFGICNLQLNESQQNELRSVVSSFYTQKIPFDMQFDLSTDQRLYCAEMVYKAFHKALKTDTFFQTTSNQRFQFVSTDNIFVNKHAQMLCRVIY